MLIPESRNQHNFMNCHDIFPGIKKLASQGLLQSCFLNIVTFTSKHPQSLNGA